MVDKTEITTPIEIKDNSVERIALDLMSKIAKAEGYINGTYTPEQKNRDYWLKLYNQCHRVVYSHNAGIKGILEDDFS